MTDYNSFKIEIVRNFPSDIDPNDAKTMRAAYDDFLKSPFLVFINGIKQENVTRFSLDLDKNDFVGSDGELADIYKPFKYTETIEKPFDY